MSGLVAGCGRAALLALGRHARHARAGTALAAPRNRCAAGVSLVSLAAMSEPTPHRRLRRSVWLALLALWLQVLAPVLHDAAMASAGAAGFDPAVQHCASPETQPDNPASPDKAPAHQMTACAAACQAFHGGGGFPPPAAPPPALA